MRAPTRRQSTLIALLAMAGLVMPATAPLAEPRPLAIKGYDPVAYFTQGAPTRGRPDVAYEWDEHRYLFASPEHRELFRADPVRYAPQFGSFCSMALAKGQIVEADPESWLIRDGKLYIFGGPVGRQLFQQSTDENIAKAEQNRPLIRNRH